ncbi:MAG: hypothetical protein K0U98_07120 [Deltaproteobacteria bacterium]|nr:hypothetical protein [Deltaproteobacteria bacterium]
MHISVYRPEGLGYSQMQPAGGNPFLTTPKEIHPLLFSNPLDTSMPYAETRYDRPGVLHTTLCEDSGTAFSPDGQIATGRNPRSCTAQDKLGVSFDGDCYDLSLLAVLDKRLGTNEGFQYELRSVDVTVFVRDGKSLNATVRDGNTPWIYPRTALNVLGKHSDFHPDSATLPTGPGISENRYKARAQKCAQGGTDGYCDFIDLQHRSTNFEVFMDGTSFDWSGSQCHSTNPGPDCRNGLFLFELSITADGKLLMLNLVGGKGLYYSYNEVGACRADGWSTLRPASDMPFDPDIWQNYDIGRAQRRMVDGVETSIPFRDSLGQDIQEGENIDGAYGWIDREGKNMFFSMVNDARDGYRASSSTDSYPYLRGHTNPDYTPGKGVVVLGAWTQGKVVHLDNGLNPTDFGGRRFERLRDPVTGAILASFLAEYDMPLYQGDPVVFSMKSSQNIFSLENHLFPYEAHSPSLPFDVVWTMSADTQRNAEVAFDEYLNDDAFIVANMAPPFFSVECSNGQRQLHPDDGFLPSNTCVRIARSPFPGGPDPIASYKFKRNPKLQNAATRLEQFDPQGEKVPDYLQLRGGARVEPVGLGGVIGRGVYLDGNNDFMEARFFNPSATDWYFGLWIDSREALDSSVRTVFFFPDNSWIGMSRDQIVAHNPRFSTNQSMDISSVGLEEGKFFHLGVKVTTEGGLRAMRFLINGTPVHGTKSSTSWPDPIPDALWWMNTCSGDCPGYTQGFEMRNVCTNGLCQVASFVVGDPGPSRASSNDSGNRKSLKAWVDDLRVYRLGAAERASSGYFDEYACNLALGTLFSVSAIDPYLVFPENVARYGELKAIGINHGILSTKGRAPAVNVCEQMRLESYSEPLDFPPQTGPDAGFCIGRVHGNPHPNSELAGRCKREEVLGIANLPLIANQPLSNYLQVPFCQSCHHSGATISGLDLTALAPGSVPREEDPRRRPMDVPATLGGCAPHHAPFLAISPRCDRSRSFVQLDDFFDSGPKAEPVP